MNFLGIMNSILIFLSSFVFIFWVGRYFFLMHYFAKQLEEIHQLEARAAVLRTILRARIRKKANRIRLQLAHEKVLLEEVGPKYDLACDLQFSSSQEFQNFLTIMKDVSIRIEQHMEKRDRETNPLTEAEKKEQQKKEDEERKQQGLQEADVEVIIWQKVIKHEKTNILIIKDLVETTIELKIKIQMYNIDVEITKKQLKVPELIHLQKFELICSLALEENLKSASDPFENALKNENKAA